MSVIERIYPEYIRLDGDTQPRAKIDQAVCDEYGERMKAGVKFPPIDVFFDGENRWLADGFHRIQAYVMAVPGEAIECNVFQGTQQDAQWHSYSVNQKHGLRRKNEDKSLAVKAALRHPNAVGYSNVQIAEHCGVDEKMVRRYRHAQELSASSAMPKMRSVSRGDQNYRQNAAHIGGHKKTKKSKKKSGRISRHAQTPVLGHSEPKPMISLSLPPQNPVIAAATIFNLFEKSFIETLIEELSTRLKGSQE